MERKQNKTFFQESREHVIHQFEKKFKIELEQGEFKYPPESFPGGQCYFSPKYLKAYCNDVSNHIFDVTRNAAAYQQLCIFCHSDPIQKNKAKQADQGEVLL